MVRLSRQNNLKVSHAQIRVLCPLCRLHRPDLDISSTALPWKAVCKACYSQYIDLYILEGEGIF